MSKLPKGPADKKMELMTSEEKLGYATRHDFNLESDKKYLEKLKKEKEDHERTKIKYEKTRNELEEKNTQLTRVSFFAQCHARKF